MEVKKSNRQMLRVLLVYKSFSLFVRKDYETLSSMARVKKLKSSFSKHVLYFIWGWVSQFFALLFHIWRTDVVYCWFADYHAFLPALFCRLTGKKFFVVLGGYDVTHVKELDYGAFNRKFRGYCAGFAMRAATLNLPVAGSLGVAARERMGDIRMKVVPTGYDPGFYKPIREKERVVLTVSITDSKQRFLVKGIDRFIELAGYMPEFRFVIVGMPESSRELAGNVPANLEIHPPLDQEKLKVWYDRSMFYAQFSRSEGLPNAVCEAMLMKCIPLGMQSGGIPDAIGDAGLVFDTWNPGKIAKQIRAINDEAGLAGKAREHIIRTYHIDRRTQVLKEILMS
jgi:glycosyltransferase involved in cell wall biosynthesis